MLLCNTDHETAWAQTILGDVCRLEQVLITQSDVCKVIKYFNAIVF